MAIRIFLQEPSLLEYSNALSSVFDLSIRNGNFDKYYHSAQAGTFGLDVASEYPLPAIDAKWKYFDDISTEKAKLRAEIGGLSYKLERHVSKTNYSY